MKKIHLPAAGVIVMMISVRRKSVKSDLILQRIAAIYQSLPREE